MHIPKDGGRTRPIGISALEDKIVQSAVRHVLEAIYEQDFLDCSVGFRPGRNAHEAIRALDKVVYRGEVNWILEANIVSFFDSLDGEPPLQILTAVRTSPRPPPAPEAIRPPSVSSLFMRPALS